MLHFLLIHLPSNIRLLAGVPWGRPYFPSKVFGSLIPIRPVLYIHPLTAVFGVDFSMKKVFHRCGFPAHQKLPALNLWLLSTDCCQWCLVIFRASCHFMLARCRGVQIALLCKKKVQAHSCKGGLRRLKQEVQHLKVTKWFLHQPGLHGEVLSQTKQNQSKPKQ